MNYNSINVRVYSPYTKNNCNKKCTISSASAELKKEIKKYRWVKTEVYIKFH